MNADIGLMDAGLGMTEGALEVVNAILASYSPPLQSTTLEKPHHIKGCPVNRSSIRAVVGILERQVMAALSSGNGGFRPDTRGCERNQILRDAEDSPFQEFQPGLMEPTAGQVEQACGIALGCGVDGTAEGVQPKKLDHPLVTASPLIRIHGGAT